MIKNIQLTQRLFTLTYRQVLPDYQSMQLLQFIAGNFTADFRNMWQRIKIAAFLITGNLIQQASFSQTVIPIEILNGTSNLRNDIAPDVVTCTNKPLPPRYEQEALIALSFFPELKDVKIKFRVKKSFATLKTRPAFLSMFMPKGHRTYIITISNKTIQKLMPITFENLPEAARVGAIGHELSHVVDFSKKSTWQSFKVALGHLNKHYMDSLEFHTDRICIDHGLGKNLESWSSYIRNIMHTVFWRGADFINKGDTHFERYMNPGTIEKYINKAPAIINARSAIAKPISPRHKISLSL